MDRRKPGRRTGLLRRRSARPCRLGTRSATCKGHPARYGRTGKALTATAPAGIPAAQLGIFLQPRREVGTQIATRDASTFARTIRQDWGFSDPDRKIWVVAYAHYPETGLWEVRERQIPSRVTKRHTPRTPVRPTERYLSVRGQGMDDGPQVLKCQLLRPSFAIRESRM